MQLLFFRRPNLARWERRPFWPGVHDGPRPGDRRDAFVRVVALENPGPPESNGPFRRAATAILEYRVFPRNLIRPVLRRTPLEVGDTVGIQYCLLPMPTLFFAARVTDRFDDQAPGTYRAGFTYRTLVGHPELGQETFSVEKSAESGEITVALRSWSRPGTLLAKSFSPILRSVQVHANQRALDHLEQCARGSSAALSR